MPIRTRAGDEPYGCNCENGSNVERGVMAQAVLHAVPVRLSDSSDGERIMAD
jgi:hypothetical protein